MDHRCLLTISRHWFEPHASSGASLPGNTELGTAGGGYLQILQFMETFNREHEKSSVVGYYIYTYIYILYVVTYIYTHIYIYILYVVIYIYFRRTLARWCPCFSCNNRCQSHPNNLYNSSKVFSMDSIHKSKDP